MVLPLGKWKVPINNLLIYIKHLPLYFGTGKNALVWQTQRINEEVVKFFKRAPITHLK